MWSCWLSKSHFTIRAFVSNLGEAICNYMREYFLSVDYFSKLETKFENFPLASISVGVFQDSNDCENMYFDSMARIWMNEWGVRWTFVAFLGCFSFFGSEICFSWVYGNFFWFFCVFFHGFNVAGLYF